MQEIGDFATISSAAVETYKGLHPYHQTYKVCRREGGREGGRGKEGGERSEQRGGEEKKEEVIVEV